MSAKFSCFVTGTDTNVGKTLISCALLHGLAQRDIRAAGMKPVAAGAVLRDKVWHNDDADALAVASTVKLLPELATPYLLHTAASPHIAAAIENLTIGHAYISVCYQHISTLADAVIVEGIGGFRVPLADDYDTSDMAVQFALPVVLVVGIRLGCINHALLTTEAIAARGLMLAGWVANTVDPTMPHAAENIATLKQTLKAPLIGVVPHLSTPSAASAASHLDFSCLPGWPAKQP